MLPFCGSYVTIPFIISASRVTSYFVYPIVKYIRNTKYEILFQLYDDRG